MIPMPFFGGMKHQETRVLKKKPFDPPRKLKKVAKGPKVLYIHGKRVARYMANDSENENILLFSQC